MVRVGLREANIRFSKYIRMVRQGNEVLLTDRGVPVAVIRPASKEEPSPEALMVEMEETGLIRCATASTDWKKPARALPGISLSARVVEDREA
ncbi:MAG: type II toxin-antitoxin system prevent-host-death family antitoxin [Acidobacteria bacterium]|nr:type II toxin-antitoxin system prevent-host-death family antitoxin [Acidobacteriota bacterium]